MEFDELINELVNWDEVDLVLEDAVNLDSGEERFCDAWESWTSSEFECLSPSPGLAFPDHGNVDVTDACRSSGREDHQASENFIGDGPPVNDVSPEVSSPGSCSSPDAGCDVPPGHVVCREPVGPDSSGAPIDVESKEGSLGNISSAESYPDLKSSSPESGCNSSDDQAEGRSSGRTANGGTGRDQDASMPMDEETKRQIRLMRNRESATQSRLRKKSYVKELEMKCRMLESHCSMLQQTVAFTSQENILLRDELNKIKFSNMNGSKSGVVEPAALPSDSLPSESPRRLTSSGPFRLASWDLLACLYLALLLPIMLMKGRSREREESRERRLRYPVRLCQVPGRSLLRIILGNLGSCRWQIRSRRSGFFPCSRQAGMRSLLGATNGTHPLSTSVYKHLCRSERSKHTVKRGRNRANDRYRKRSSGKRSLCKLSVCCR